MAFARILRSSAIMGGAQAVTLATGFLRAKLIAVMIGPAGVGLLGVLSSFNGNLSALAGWGLGTSGVRVVSASSGEDRPCKIAAVRYLGRRLSWLGLAGVILLFWPVSQMTFPGGGYATEILIAGLAVPCLIAASMWSALLQAHGRLQPLARVQVMTSVAGLGLGLPLIYFFGSIGVASSLFLAAAVPALATWAAARRFCPPVGADPVREDVRQLVRLGAALMAVGFFAQLSAYVVRLFLIRSHGLESAGYYQAAIAIAGSLPGFVFTAMGTDFFPRIASVSDESEAQELSEKQIRAGLLLALPLFTVLLTLGQPCIRLLYARGFDPAIPLLSWMIWGIFFRLLAWPLGYWLLARGSARAVILVEAAANIVATVLPLALMPLFGLVGVAMGFCGGYCIYSFVMLAVSRRRSGRWLGAGTLAWFALGAAVLGGAQALALALGGYGGLIPSVLVAGACAWIYRHSMRRE